MKILLVLSILLSSVVGFAGSASVDADRNLIYLALSYFSTADTLNIISAEITSNGVLVKYRNLKSECLVRIIPATLDKDGNIIAHESAFPPPEPCH